MVCHYGWASTKTKFVTCCQIVRHMQQLRDGKGGEITVCKLRLGLTVLQCEVLRIPTPEQRHASVVSY